MFGLRALQRSRSLTSAALSGAVVSFALAIGSGRPALADSVWVGSDPAKALERKNMKIEGLTPEGLVFRSAAVDRVAEPRPLKDIARIAVDDEPALNAAETAFVGDKWDDAVAGYQKTVNTTRKDWVGQYATIRLVAAAAKSGKFTAAASAYAAAVQRDLQTAEDARPDVLKAPKADLPAAISAVRASLGTQGLKVAQKQALQTFLGQLYVANGQLKEAEAISGRPAAAPAPAATGTIPGNAARTESTASNPAAAAAPPAPAAPAANKAQVDLKLQLAQAAVQQKKYQEAIDAIDSVSSSIIEPADQAAALFALADAKAGLAGNDAAKLKDAALAYMRVVAHFKGKADAPHVADSLLRAGTVLERANVLPDALAAYEAVQADFKDGPQAKEAATAAARVRKAMDAGGKSG
jgi:hypothetical protein